MLLGENPAVSPGSRRQVQHDDPPRPGGDQRVAQLGHQQVRQHAGEPGARARARAGPPTATAASGLRAGRRAGRAPAGPAHAGRGWSHGDLAADPAGAAAGRRLEARDLGLDVQRLAGHRQHPAAAAEQPATSSSAATGSPSDLSSPASSRLPTAWPASAPVAAEPVLQHRRVGHGAAPARRRRPARPAPSAGRRAAAAPSSRRSRPDEPPSSATVTTAVTSASVSRRSAASEACRPWPPPSATTAAAGGVDGLPGALAPPGLPVLLTPRSRCATSSRRPSPTSRGRSPRRSRRCGACRRCSRPPASGSACPRAGSRRSTRRSSSV